MQFKFKKKQNAEIRPKLQKCKQNKQKTNNEKALAFYKHASVFPHTDVPKCDYIDFITSAKVNKRSPSTPRKHLLPNRKANACVCACGTSFHCSSP